VEYVDESISQPEPGWPILESLNPHPGWSPASANPATWTRLVGEKISALGARKVGVDAIDFRLVEALRQQCPSVDFVSVSLELYRARRIKDPLEIPLLEAASRVNSLAMDAAMNIVGPGVTDHEILAEAARAQHLLGVEFATHSVCNVRGGSGSWFARNATLKEGDAYFFDIGCYGVGGYASDAARTAFVGEPRPEVLSAYRHLLHAYELAQQACIPGARASEVQNVLNTYLVAHSLGRTPYPIGHGIGLRMCELPAVSQASFMDIDDTIEEGMCIALEPETTVLIDGEPMVLKVEDNFVVEANGLRALTTPYSVESSVV
jgi:Xaa-Pro aminopeptidase